MRALAISLALHAWLLALGGPRSPSQQPAGALQASLRPVAATSPIEVPPAAAALPADGTAPVPRRRAAGGAVSSGPVIAIAASAANVNTSTAAAQDRSPAETGLGGQGVQGGGQGAGARGAVPAGPGGDGADADGLRQYRLSLAREARRFKRYPERALLAGIGGTAEVRVERDIGAIPVARLARSSGNEALDAAALSMMREAAPRTEIPEMLRGRSFAVSLPVIFDASAE